MNGEVERPNKDDLEGLKRYPKFVWNWLAGNHPQMRSTNRGALRFVLFPEVEPPANMIERIQRFFTVA